MEWMNGQCANIVEVCVWRGQKERQEEKEVDKISSRVETVQLFISV